MINLNLGLLHCCWPCMHNLTSAIVLNAMQPDLDLYPEELRSTIDEINSWTYPNIKSVGQPLISHFTPNLRRAVPHALV
jgi:hypothetical protein